MKIMSVLKKMELPVTGLRVEAHGERKIEHPTVLTEISLEFTVMGDGVDPAAVARVPQASEEHQMPDFNLEQVHESAR